MSAAGGAAAAPAGAAAWVERARRLRAAQDMIAADAAMAAARALAPDDRLIAFLHAQSRFELGHPAAALFADVRRLWPDNADALRNHALALAAEGEGAAAEALLAGALAAAPDWLDGQRVLASLRWTLRRTDFAAGYAAALAARPGHAGLWLGWFGALAQVRAWDDAAAVLARARAALGDSVAVRSAQAFLAGETGDLAGAARLLAALGRPDDAFLAIARLRLLLRQRRPERIEAIALPLTRTAAAGQVWPYLATAWRLLGDRRAGWLDGAGPGIAPGAGPALVTVRDDVLPGDALALLAALLRAQHTAAAAYPEQTVRGGTQTDRSILLRHEPAVQAARAQLMAAVGGIAAALPPRDAAHPVLGRAREDLRIAGSWSVRLGAGGHNVAHSHPHGWLSAVCYVAVDDIGAAPAGHLELGVPPAELGLDLAPLARVAPRPGRLVVFPATMWHGTIPTAGGERLNIAFDIVPAAG